MLIFACFSLLILSDSTSVAQEIGKTSTESIVQSTANSQTSSTAARTSSAALTASSRSLESHSTKSNIKTVNFDHDGDKKQEFSAYADFLNATDVSFVARHPSDECLDADAQMNKVVFNFGGLNCSTAMMWGKSGFFWGRGDSKIMSLLPSDSKDVRVSLSNKNVYLVGEDKDKATDIFVCPINKTITTIKFLFEKSANNTLPKGCQMTFVLNDNGFLDPDDITALSIIIPTTNIVQTTVTSASSVSNTHTMRSTTVFTRKTRPTPIKTTKTTTVKTTTIIKAATTAKNATTGSTNAHTAIHSTEHGTSKKSSPNAYIPTKKAPIVPVIRVESTTENGAGDYRLLAVIHIGIPLMIIALY